MAGPHRWALGRRHTGGGKPHGMVASLPTGLVSFLFTDVEGSTRRFDCADCGARSTDVHATSCSIVFSPSTTSAPLPGALSMARP